MCQTKPGLKGLLPDEVRGWKTGAPDQEYGPETLYKYINGGAELYISFDFQRVLSRTYERPEQPEIIVDLFDMGESRNAFGVFSMSREAVESDFGQGSQYTEGLLLFWMDRYYVSILASPETPESKAAVTELAGAVQSAVGAGGELPRILGRLPEPGLVPESVRYFRHPAWLNSHYFVADENLFHMEGGVEALLAKYGEGGEMRILLLVNYPDRENAERGLRDFLRHYLPEGAVGAPVKLEDGSWCGCRLDGSLLAVVFKASEARQVTGLLDSVGRPADKTEDNPDENRGTP